MPVDVIPHGTDGKVFFKLPDEDRKKLKERLYGPNKYVVGSVGRNQYRKEFPRLLEAFKAFSEDKPNAILYLHTCPRDNAPGYPLPELVYKFGLEGKVIFPKLANGAPMQPGHGVSVEELNMYYNAMDVMVLPSNAGGWELPLTEAFSCEVPVITTDYAAMGEVADNGRAIKVPIVTEYSFVGSNLGRKGIIDIPKLTEAMNVVYKDQTENNGLMCKEMIRKGKEFVTKVSWDYVAAEFDRIFTEEYSISHADVSKDRGEWNPCRQYPDFPNNDYRP